MVVTGTYSNENRVKQVRICATKGKFTKTLHVLVHNSTVPSPTEKRGWPIKSADKIPWNDRQILNFTDRLLRYWSLNMDSLGGRGCGGLYSTNKLQRARIIVCPYPVGRDKCRLCISCNVCIEYTHGNHRTTPKLSIFRDHISGTIDAGKI